MTVPLAVPLTENEIADVRSSAPGCTDTLIHLNHCGSSLPDQRVLDVQVGHLQLEATIGGYEAAKVMVDADANVASSIARMIEAETSEIARFGSAAEAWNAAFWSIPMERGQRIIVHDHEYGANAIAFIHAAKTRGIVIDRVPSDEDGQVSVDALAQRLERADDVALISLTHVPTNGGLVNPAVEVGRLANAARVPYLLDACQSVGQRIVDVDEIGCDFLSATGRKFLRGPRGTGFLYARTAILDRVTPSQPDHHGADWSSTDDYTFADGAQRFEYWEYSHAGWLGLGAAVDVALEIGVDRIQATITERAAQLRVMLADIGMTIYDEGIEQSGIVTTATPSVSSANLQAALGRAGVNASVTFVGSSRYDVERRNLPPLLRLSVHCTTTITELERAVEVLEQATEVSTPH
ncbi:aminotransferase class V-fold PLP-dependent enzyme [Ilumatobacter sp.]|uniref:aminotransferase class V-fold PLP-dependent enzyme n=1 Tax=Ilumatobacter sp. TaxID=1967498 RepID=UPI0037526B1B|nr:aminotransferase class V-fold PLP-dependent enzyme [Ilumatobacter sp.]